MWRLQRNRLGDVPSLATNVAGSVHRLLHHMVEILNSKLDDSNGQDQMKCATDQLAIDSNHSNNMISIETEILPRSFVRLQACEICCNGSKQQCKTVCQ